MGRLTWPCPSDGGAEVRSIGVDSPSRGDQGASERKPSRARSRMAVAVVPSHSLFIEDPLYCPGAGSVGKNVISVPALHSKEWGGTGSGSQEVMKWQ